jgi:hypothetical protein
MEEIMKAELAEGKIASAMADKSIDRAIAEGKIASKYEVSSIRTVRGNGAVKFTIIIYLVNGGEIRYRM